MADSDLCASFRSATNLQYFSLPPEEKNMALNKPTAQSSIYYNDNSDSSNVVKGNINPLFDLGGNQSKIFTARKRSLGQDSIFRSVCQEFCSQGGEEYLGRYPSQHQVHPQHQVPPLGPGTPPWDQVHPPGLGTLPRTRYTPGTRYSPPPAVHMLGDTGNKWAVRILLECILVKLIFILTESSKWFAIKVKFHDCTLDTPLLQLSRNSPL